MAEAPGDETSLNRLIGPDRRLAIVRDSLHDVRAIGRAHGATVNDVLLAATAAGLRALLIHRGEPVGDVTLRIFVPVSLRGRMHGTVTGNHISQMVVPLALGPSDPVERLRAIAAETIVRKGRTRNPPTLLFRFGVVRRLVLKAIVGQRVNVTSASLIGPRKPLYLAGARILDLFPMLNLIGNQDDRRRRDLVCRLVRDLHHCRWRRGAGRRGGRRGHPRRVGCAAREDVARPG